MSTLIRLIQPSGVAEACDQGARTFLLKSGGRRMKRANHFLAAVVLTLVATSTSLALVATSASAVAVIEKTKLQGVGVLAEFSTRDSSGCISTAVAVIADRRTVTEDGVAPVGTEFVAILITQFNLCTSQLLLQGVAEAASHDLSVAPNLQTARLKGTFEFQNFVAQTTMPITVDFTFTSIGKSAVVTLSDKFVLDGLMMRTQGTGKIRPATAVGTVSSSSTVFISSKVSDIARIEDRRSLSLIVERF